ncbi:uncharacterized protein MELLADRAFT_113873 [Melampsora larici-populina 98AG31]|uniref:Uncharacterized protein n=1 Tax=Melampsora larici-populina (strain 98AG31 / pathotype 3-4-7) TaxID=747676 RepID=F4SBB3_MELLP|nr:uncharacterized protein MELLADRAFT_113873 [Melampsora larici-populina 98AG31]EGF98061.1 hypothetical protein MELLADRAFT_113873 [Melampsora larici-populina 98AG31]
MENQTSRTVHNLNSISNSPIRSYRRRPFSNGLRKREGLPISSNFDIEPSQSNLLSIHDDQIEREVENIFRPSDDDEDEVDQIPPVPSTSEVSEKGYLSSLRNPPPSTSSSTLVNEEESYPDNIRKKIRGTNSHLSGMEYGPSHLLSAFEIPQGAHFVHHTPSQPFAQNGQSVTSSKLNQDYSRTQRSFNHFELRQADHESSPPLAAERSPSPDHQPEPSPHRTSNTSHSLRPGNSPPIPSHEQPPPSPRRSYPTVHDQNIFKAMIHSPKTNSLSSHQSYNRSSTQDISSSRYSKIPARKQEDEDEDVLQTPKQTKNTDFCSAAMAAIDQVVSGQKPKVSNTTFESNTPRPVDSISASRPISARFPRPPLAHLAGRLKAQSTQDASKNRQEGPASKVDHPPPLPIQEHVHQLVHNTHTDEFSAKSVSAPSRAPLDPPTTRKSVPSTGLQDERRLKGLLKNSPDPQRPAPTVETHPTSNPVNNTHSGPHLARTQSHPNPLHKSKPSYDGSVVYKSQRAEIHESSIGFERQQNHDKLASNQQHGWPASPFLRPKNPDSDSDSGDSPDLPVVVEELDQGPNVASQVLLNRHSVRKKVAFVGASDHQGSHEIRLQSQVPQPLHSKIGSSPEDYPYDPANLTFKKETSRFAPLQHSMSETSVMDSGSQTLSTPKITGFYPMTPAPPAPRRSNPLPVPSSSTLSSATDKRLDQLKAQEPEGLSRKQHHEAGPDQTSEIPLPVPSSSTLSSATDKRLDRLKAQEPQGVSRQQHREARPVQTSQSGHHLHIPDRNIEKQKLENFKGKGKAIEEPTVNLDAYFTPVPKSKKESEPKGQAQRTLDTQLAYQSRRMNTDDTLLDATQLEFSRLTAPTPHPPGWFAETPVPHVKIKPKKRVVKSPPIETDQTHIGNQDNLSRRPPDVSAIPSSSRQASSDHLAGPKRDQSSQFVTTTAINSLPGTARYDVKGKPSHPPPKSNVNTTDLLNQPVSQSTNNMRTHHPRSNSPNLQPTHDKVSSTSTLESSNQRPSLSTKPESTPIPPTRPPEDISAQVMPNRAQHLRPPTRQSADITHASMAVNCLNLLQQSIRGKLGPLDDVDLMNMSLPPCAGGDYSTFEVSGQQDVGQIAHLLKDLLGDIQELKTTKTGVESLAESSSFLLADDTLRPKASPDPAMLPHSHNSILGALARQSDKVATTRAPLVDHLGFNDESLRSPESQDVKTDIKTCDLISKPRTSLRSRALLDWIKIPTSLNGYKRYQWVIGLIFLQVLMVWLVISLATVRAVNLAHAGHYYPRYVLPGHTGIISRILQSYHYLSPERLEDTANSSWWQIGLRSIVDISWFIIDWIFGFRWSLDRITNVTSFQTNDSENWFESMIELIFSFFFENHHERFGEGEIVWVNQAGVTSYLRSGFSPT